MFYVLAQGLCRRIDTRDTEMGQVVFFSTHRKGARHILDMQEGGRSSLLVSLYYYEYSG